MKIRAVGDDLYHADRQTDGRTDTESANNACSQFCESAWSLFSDFGSVDWNKHKIFGV